MRTKGKLKMKLSNLPTTVILKGGIVLDPLHKTKAKADVLIENGKIKAIGQISTSGSAQVIGCHGLIVTHGFCDLHVHFREPGREDKETLQSGARAALAGGFTRVCVMPNTNPPLDSPESIRFVKEKARDCPIHIHPIGAVTKGQAGQELTEMGAMLEEGAVAFSDDGSPISHGGMMRRALEYATMFNVPVINHAEDENIRSDGVMNEGLVSTQLGLSGNPTLAESTMVHRDLDLSILTGAKLHVPHVSTGMAADHIRKMKKSNSRISAEVTPHHMYFNDEALSTYNTNLKVSPPIRSEGDRIALIKAVMEGTIDCIATDHAPHTIEDKESTFDMAPFGMIGLESCLGIVNKVLVKGNGMSLKGLILKLTVNPRNIMGFETDLFAKGAPAEIVVFDADEVWDFDRNAILSRSSNSPFIGESLIGRVKYTIAKGKLASME